MRHCQEKAERSLGGDADTLACITGGLAGAFYGGVPRSIAARALALLDDGLRRTVTSFCEAYAIAMPGGATDDVFSEE